MRKEIHILHAPINLGLSRYPDGRERGCGKLPDALEKMGFHTSVQAKVTKRMAQPPYPKESVYHEGALNGAQVASFSVDLANSVEEILNHSAFPLVLGGDCSVLVGSTLALARRGRYGLIHFDAHPDYYHKGNKARAVVGGMALAIVTGKGPDILSNLENQKPYIQSKHAFTFGYRESDPEKEIIEEAKVDGISCWSAERITREGIIKTASKLKKIMNLNDVDGFWVHLDADVLDASIMPCVDCPEPNGLQWRELAAILKVVLGSDKLVGMNVTILDPDLDPNKKVIKTFSKMLIEVLRPKKIASV